MPSRKQSERMPVAMESKPAKREDVAVDPDVTSQWKSRWESPASRALVLQMASPIPGHSPTIRHQRSR